MDSIMAAKTQPRRSSPSHMYPSPDSHIYYLCLQCCRPQTCD